MPFPISRLLPSLLCAIPALLGILMFAGVTGCDTLGNFRKPGPAPLPIAVPPEDAVLVEQIFTEKKISFLKTEAAEVVMTPENSRLIVKLDTQRVYLFTDGKLAAASKISSGRRNHRTEVGEFTLGGKSKNHKSNIYGKFVGADGSTLIADVDTRVDPLPEGGTYVGSSMANFLRLHHQGNSTAMGFHTGRLPGYPASHGCLRLPSSASAFFYDRLPLGTSVLIHGEKNGVSFGQKQGARRKTPKMLPPVAPSVPENAPLTTPGTDG